MGVDIRLLGPVAAFRDGEPGALGGPRQRAVLARLALSAGQVVTVDRLIDDVWVGQPPPTATNTVQSYVSLLRRALGAAELVRREGPGYVLDVPRDTLDVHRFEDGVSAAARVVRTDPAAALDLLDAALGEWRGPCLVDVADMEWARPATVRWDELRLVATEQRYDALLALGRPAEAASGLERLVEEHPLREGFVRRLMLALYRSGRQADALRACATTRAVLADELGLDPTPDLQALERAILDHDPSLNEVEDAVAPPAAAPSGPRAEPNVAGGGELPRDDPAALPLPATASRAAAPPLAGRGQLLDALRAVWDVALDGSPRLAVVIGEAGAGKTTLAGHFATSLQAERASVLWGRAAQDAIVPFEPLVQALRTALNALSPRARQRVIADRGAMTVLLPELKQLVPAMRAERPSPDVERYLLFETVADLLAVESALAPILLVVDDIQWADAPTIKLLEHVLHHDRGGRVMVLATQRIPSEDPHPDLDRLLMGLARDGDLTRVDVRALDSESIGDLLELAGRPREGARGLRDVTGGNAFFVSEVIASGMGRDGSGTEVPDSIRAMLATRLDRLPPASTNIVSMAAVADRLSTLPVLVAATALDADEVLDAADVAVAAGLLVDDGGGRLVAPHALVRHAVLARLSAARRQDHHRRIAAALSQASGSEVAAAEVAHHTLEAGSLVPRPQRLAATLAGGQEALGRVAYEEAAGWVERARTLVGDDVGPDVVILEILDSETRRVLGDRDGALTAARRAARLAADANDPILLARAMEAWVPAISGVGFEFGQTADPELVATLGDAIAGLPTDAVDHQVRLRSMLVSVLVDADQAERQERLSAEALDIAGRANDPALMASALWARRLALWRRDRLDERLPIGLEAVEQAHRAGDVHLELTSMIIAMTDLLESGRVDDQLAMLDEFERRAATQRSPLYDVFTDFLRSCRLLVTGEYEAAERLANAALAAGLSSHGANTELAHAGQMVVLAWDRGQLADFVDFVAVMAASTPDFPTWRIALIGALIAAGRPTEAEPLIDDLVTADAVVLPDDSLFFTGASFLVEAARALGRRNAAVVLRRTLEPYAGRVVVTGLGGVSLGPVRRYVGVAAHVAGDVDAAIDHLRVAIDESIRFGMRPATARARRDLADALTTRAGPGDVAEAVRERELAETSAAELGLVLGPL